MSNDILERLLQEQKQKEDAVRAERARQLEVLQQQPKKIDTRPMAGFIDGMYGLNTTAGAQAVAEGKQRNEALMQALLKEERAPQGGNLNAAALRQATRQTAGERAPPGYRFNPDGSLTAIQGGPAWAKDQEKSQQQESAADSIQLKGQGIIRDAGLAMMLIDESDSWLGNTAAGPLGGAIGAAPLTGALNAGKLKTRINSLTSSLAVDQLLDIKRQGSGLGQVPQSQLMMLSELLGNLKQTQDSGELRRLLQDITFIYSDIIKKVDRDPYGLAVANNVPLDLFQGQSPQNLARWKALTEQWGMDLAQEKMAQEQRAANPSGRTADRGKKQDTPVEGSGGIPSRDAIQKELERRRSGK
jgi:hypothetical protein